jgi:dihydrolipoamide dehydrogenase
MLSARRIVTTAKPLMSSSARMYSASKVAQDKYDLVVVGGGPGGYVAAIKAAQLGLKTACVESRGSLGGTCLNVGCIPSKALLHSSHMFDEANHAFAEHGVIINGSVSMDVPKMIANKNKAVKGLTGGIEFLFKKYKVDYVKGFGKLTGPNSVNVELNAGGTQALETKNILLAVGSEVTPLPPCPVDNAGQKIVDSTGALDMQKVPKSMVVVGGGVIGLEMGSVWRRLGAEVTVVEFLDTITPAVDKETTAAFMKILKKQGFKFKLSTKVTSSKVTANGVELTLEPSAGGEATKMETEVVLVSTGRRPFTKNIGLEALNIPVDKLGRIEVNEHFATKVPSIFAIGDCINGPMLAHKAEEEGIACVENIAGFAGHVNYDVIPGVIYTHPEVATVGKTEEELKAAGVKYNKGSFPFSANSRARSNGDSDGQVKVLADKETDRILGVHIVGPGAGEMIAEAVLAMEYGAASEDVARTCHAHPTLSEALKEACMATYGKPIHS